MKAKRKMKLTDTSLLLLITVVVFFAMYIGAILFQGKGFLKPQTFFNILNANAALIIISCGMSLVMITGGIDISVGGVVALVSMCCAVYLDYHGGNIFGAIGISLLIGLGFSFTEFDKFAHLLLEAFAVMINRFGCHHGSHITSSGRIPDHAGSTANQSDRLISCHLQSLH